MNSMATKTTAKSSQATKPVADVCLYGNTQIGFGYLTRVESTGKMTGDGEPKEGRSCTDCLHLAKADLEAQGIAGKAQIAIFMAGGERVSYVGIQDVTYFGSLKWEVAPVLTINATDLMTAATQDSR